MYLTDLKVETIAECVKGSKQMTVGVVTDAEAQEATPAPMVAPCMEH